MRIKARHGIGVLALMWNLHAAAQEATSPQAASVPAQQGGYVDVLAGLAYTDNALQTSANRTSDGIGVAGFSTDYLRTGNLSLSLLGNLERLEYLHHSFAGSFYGQFFGSGVFGKPTNLLQWQLADSFGEEMTDPLAAPTPLNLQTINYLTTGPLVNLHFGLTNRLTLFGNYTRTTYQRSPFDSQMYQGGARFRHALAGTSSVSLDASASHTQYLDTAAILGYFAGASSYDIRQASIEYRGTFVRTTVLLRAGYNTIQYSGARRHGAPLYEARLSRQISPFSTIYVDGQQTYSTNGQSLFSPGAQVNLQLGASVNPGYAVAQPFNRRSADVGWLFSRARTSLSLTGTYEQDVYDQTGITTQYNRREESVAALIGRQLRPTMRVQLRMQGYWDHYSQLGAQTRREDVELTASKRFVRTMIAFYVERLQQSGTPGRSGFFATSYHDDRVGIYVTYDLFGQRSTQSALQGMPGMTGFMGGY